MPLLTTKDLAVEMRLDVRTVKRWWKRLGVPPDACRVNGCHRWTPAAARRLFDSWSGYWRRADTTPEIVSEKASGQYHDPNQLLLNLIFHETQHPS